MKNILKLSAMFFFATHATCSGVVQVVDPVALFVGLEELPPHEALQNIRSNGYSSFAHLADQIGNTNLESILEYDSNKQLFMKLLMFSSQDPEGHLILIMKMMLPGEELVTKWFDMIKKSSLIGDEYREKMAHNLLDSFDHISSLLSDERQATGVLSSIQERVARFGPHHGEKDPHSPTFYDNLEWMSS
jgi:hypothetical protein